MKVEAWESWLERSTDINGSIISVIRVRLSEHTVCGPVTVWLQIDKNSFTWRGNFEVPGSLLIQDHTLAIDVFTPINERSYRVGVAIGKYPAQTGGWPDLPRTGIWFSDWFTIVGSPKPSKPQAKHPPGYILQGHDVFPCWDEKKLTEQMNNIDSRTVRVTEVISRQGDKYVVSTVFTVYDLRSDPHYSTAPLVFETSVFDSTGYEIDQERACTWEGAEGFHEQAVKLLDPIAQEDVGASALFNIDGTVNELSKTHKLLPDKASLAISSLGQLGKPSGTPSPRSLMAPDHKQKRKINLDE